MRATQLRPSGWWNAVVPVASRSPQSSSSCIETGAHTLALGRADAELSLWQIFGNADSYFALLWGSVLGLLSAVAMAWLQKLLTWDETQRAVGQGALVMLPALLVLWLASSLSTMTGHDPLPDATCGVSAVRVLSCQGLSLVHGRVPRGLAFAAIWKQRKRRTWRDGCRHSFLCSRPPSVFRRVPVGGRWRSSCRLRFPWPYGAIANQTEIVWHLHPVLIGTIGSVLAGSIFGDHCSPISDTTVLSSQACGCEHSAHVWTQLPYALVVGLVSIVLGTLPVGLRLAGRGDPARRCRHDGRAAVGRGDADLREVRPGPRRRAAKSARIS